MISRIFLSLEYELNKKHTLKKRDASDNNFALEKDASENCSINLEQNWIRNMHRKRRGDSERTLIKFG